MARPPSYSVRNSIGARIPIKKQGKIEKERKRERERERKRERKKKKKKKRKRKKKKEKEKEKQRIKNVNDVRGNETRREEMKTYTASATSSTNCAPKELKV